MGQAQLAPPPIFQFFDGNGEPLAGGLLYSFEAGGTTPHATYIDSTMVTPNTNPIVLDSEGRCVVWMDGTAYKFVLKDSLGSTQWTRDNVQFIPDGSITTVMLADGSVTTAKIADGAVTTAKIPDSAITTAKIADNAITAAKIPDASITTSKLTGSTEIAFSNSGDLRFGSIMSAFPRKPWTTPTVIPDPASPLVGDGNCVEWSHNGRILAVAENNTEMFALFSRFRNTLTRLPSLTPFVTTFTGGCISMSPDGQYLAVASNDPTGALVFLYQKAKNTWGAITPLPITIGEGITGLHWHPNSRSLAASFFQTPFVHVWNLADVSPAVWGARYVSNNGQSISTSATAVINFEDKVWDPMNAVVPGSGWAFVCYREGVHRVGFSNILTPITGGGRIFNAWLNYFSINSGATSNYPISLGSIIGSLASIVVAMLNGYIELYMFPNDALYVTEFQNTGATVSLDSSDTSNWISISEGQNYDSLSTFAAITNPSTLPAGPGKCCRWSHDGSMLAVGHDSYFYTFTVTTASASAGATYTNNGVTYTVSTTIASGTTLTARGFGPPLTSGNLIKTGGTGDSTIAFSANVQTQQYMSVYSFDGSTLTKIGDPVALPPGQVNGFAWSLDDSLLTAAHKMTPFMTTYQVDRTSGITLTAIAPPATLPTGNGNAAAYSNRGTELAIAHDVSPFVSTYALTYVSNVPTLTKLPDPGALPTGNGKSVSWSADDEILSIGHVSSPYMTNLETTGVFGTEAVTFVKEVNLD